MINFEKRFMEKIAQIFEKKLRTLPIKEEKNMKIEEELEIDFIKF